MNSLRPGGVELPSISVRVEYDDVDPGRKPVVARIDIFVVNSAELNVEISPDNFQVAVPIATVVSNRTADPDTTVRATRVPTDVSEKAAQGRREDVAKIVSNSLRPGVLPFTSSPEHSSAGLNSASQQGRNSSCR